MTHRVRHTKQRAAILDTLEAMNRPLSLDEIQVGARERCPGIGERTIFRNLKEMMDEYLLVRVFLPGKPTLYELPTGEHRPHFICRNCDQVFQLPGETPEVMSRYKAPPEFEIDGEDVVFFGRCPACKK
ncbi:transcriptional repressor [Rubellicoccus peritrichatus]|uniref:Transcriptional repressor n=1 Tax=Rubellicoccus peritrichatus TaxID=3080537 RepID=A0AAQ3QU59_9BACT|nr:transcriptional repressor [Puniceicoccus sp. CR14]WOO40128.1 transcriptional repressor [Puniceicoccus sp. CR14]